MLQPRDVHSAVNRKRCSNSFGIPKKIGDKLVYKTWLAHARGRCTNVSEELATWRILHC